MQAEIIRVDNFNCLGLKYADTVPRCELKEEKVLEVIARSIVIPILSNFSIRQVVADIARLVLLVWNRGTKATTTVKDIIMGVAIHTWVAGVFKCINWVDD
jgi:hypothetical protein